MVRPSRSYLGTAAAVLLVVATRSHGGVHAFIGVANVRSRPSLLVPRQALWRHFIPEDVQNVWNSPFFNGNEKIPESLIRLDEEPQRSILDDNHKLQPPSKLLKIAGTKQESAPRHVMMMASSFLLMASLVVSALPSHAVSGGGLDFANLDITGQNFSNGNYKGKDFTQVIAKGTTFANSVLQGCRFYKAYLVNADFSGADLRGASLEDTSLDNALLTNANAAGAYFSSSILDVKSVENADFTDAQIPLKSLPVLCQREDVKGVNPATGVDTRESLMCP